MPGLQCRVLPIVGKAEQFLIRLLEAGIVQPIEYRECGNRCRSTTALTAQFGQLGSLVSLGVVKHASGRVEQQGSAHEPTPPLEWF